MSFRVYDWRTNLGAGDPGWHGAVAIPHPVAPPVPTYPPNYGAIGTYRPSASTTGIPPGTVLTRSDGDRTITAPGTVLDSLDIWGRVTIACANVTIQRCRVRGSVTNTTASSCIQTSSGSAANLLVQDCELVPQSPSVWVDGINGHDFTLRRCNIRNVIDPANLWNSTKPQPYDINVTIEQNWFHDLAYFTPDPQHSNNQSHNDGIQFEGGFGAIVRGNSIESYYGAAGSSQPGNAFPSPTPVATGPSLSCFMFAVDVGPLGGFIIEDNWLMGADLPVNCGGSPGANLGRIWRNRFSGDSRAATGDPWTINLRADQTCDTGDGTANQNVFHATGLPITVRHTG